MICAFRFFDTDTTLLCIFIFLGDYEIHLKFHPKSRRLDKALGSRTSGATALAVFGFPALPPPDAFGGYRVGEVELFFFNEALCIVEKD